MSDDWSEPVAPAELPPDNFDALRAALQCDAKRETPESRLGGEEEEDAKKKEKMKKPKETKRKRPPKPPSETAHQAGSGAGSPRASATSTGKMTRKRKMAAARHSGQELVSWRNGTAVVPRITLRDPPLDLDTAAAPAIPPPAALNQLSVAVAPPAPSLVPVVRTHLSARGRNRQTVLWRRDAAGMRLCARNSCPNRIQKQEWYALKLCAQCLGVHYCQWIGCRNVAVNGSTRCANCLRATADSKTVDATKQLVPDMLGLGYHQQNELVGPGRLVISATLTSPEDKDHGTDRPAGVDRERLSLLKELRERTKRYGSRR